MATLAGSTIASTYTYLLKMDGTSGLTSSLVAVQDGDATDSALKISTTSASVAHTVTTAASTPIALLVDANTSGVAAQNSVGLHVDFDRTVAGSGTAAHNDIGINLDVNSASLGTSSLVGMDIDVVGATSGTSTATGLAVTVGSADTNYAALFNGGNLGIGNTAPASALHLTGTMQVGVDGTGHDVIFYGNSSTSNMTWDTSGDDLFLNDATLSVDQDDDIYGIYVDSEAPNYNAVEIYGKYGLYSHCDISGGRAAYFTRNIAESGSLPCVSIVESNANNTQPALKVTQAGAGYGIDIDQNANAHSLFIDSESTTQPVIQVEADVLTTGGIAKFYSAATTNDGRSLVNIVNANSGATGTKCLNIQQEAGNIALRVEQNANHNAVYIDSDNTTEPCVNIIASAVTTGPTLKVYSAATNGSARNILDVRNDDAGADSAVPLYIKQAGNARNIQVEAIDASFSSNVVFLNAYGRSASSSFEFLVTYTDGDNDIQHNLRGDGAVLADAAYDGSGADYAEYFESKDGKAIAVGTTVKLDGDKVVACEDGDTPMGVVRPYGNSVVIGNSAPLKWTGKYLKDDYGAYIMEEYTVTEWREDTDEIQTEATEKKAATYVKKDFLYNTDEIPSDVTVPSDAKVTSTEKDGSKLMRRKKNPDYDESKTYTPREKRDEWCLIGLLGQIPITKGQPMADSWIKMKDISDTVEMYFVK